MAQTLASTAHARARWHALRRGGAAATWARPVQFSCALLVQTRGALLFFLMPLMSTGGRGFPRPPPRG